MYGGPTNFTDSVGESDFTDTNNYCNSRQESPLPGNKVQSHYRPSCAMPINKLVGGMLSASLDNGHLFGNQTPMVLDKLTGGSSDRRAWGNNRNHVDVFSKRGNTLNVISGNKSMSGLSGPKSARNQPASFRGVAGSEFIKKMRENEMHLPNPEIQENTENSESEELSH